MPIKRDSGTMIFAVLYILIGLFFITLTFIAPLLVQSNIFMIYSYVRGAENPWALFIGLAVCFLIGAAFMAASIMLLKLKKSGQKLALWLLIALSVFGMYFLLPFLIAHLLYFSNGNIKNLRTHR